jgi:hypothetical protein
MLDRQKSLLSATENVSPQVQAYLWSRPSIVYLRLNLADSSFVAGMHLNCNHYFAATNFLWCILLFYGRYYSLNLDFVCRFQPLDTSSILRGCQATNPLKRSFKMASILYSYMNHDLFNA